MKQFGLHLFFLGVTLMLSGCGGLVVQPLIPPIAAHPGSSFVPAITATIPLPTPTPDLIGMDVQTHVTTSPDGIWEAQVTVVLPIVGGGEDYYTKLQVVRTNSTHEWIAVDEWQRFGLGYTVPLVLGWSTDGRYLYFTNMPHPDGCALFANGSDLNRLDLVEGDVLHLVKPVGSVVSLSPAADRFVSIAEEHNLLLHDLYRGEVQRIELDLANENVQVGAIIWSPDGASLVLAVAYSPCGLGDQWSHSILRVDIEAREVNPLYEMDQRRLRPVAWPWASRILLADHTGAFWWLDAETGELSAAGATYSPDR